MAPAQQAPAVPERSRESAEELLTRARSGDRVAAAALLDELRPGLVRYCRARLLSADRKGADALAAGIGTEVFTRLIGPKAGAPIGPAGLLTFAYRRARDRADAPDFTAVVPAARTAPSGLTHADLARTLLSRLPPRQREVVLLCLVARLPLAQAADVMELSPAQAHDHLRQALSELRLAGTAAGA